MSRVTSSDIGFLSGIIYILLLVVSIPLLIILDPDFSKTFNSFDPMSQLGTTESSEIYYRSLHIIAGILALLYIELEFLPNRIIYKNLKNWNWAARSIRIGALGQIAMGIFDESIFPQHLFSTIAFAVGLISYISLVSFNLDNQLIQKSQSQKLINSGYIISIIAMMNALYFRYSTVRGIWQFFVLISTLTWFVFEARNFKDNGSKLQISKDAPLLKVNNISYLMLVFGIYLIIFGLLLNFYPKLEPWTCSENDQRCDVSNIVPLLISGFILISFVLYHILQVKQNRNQLDKTHTNG